MRNQNLFIGLDSVPVGIAAVVLNFFHPGWCFPKHHQGVARTEEKTAGGDGREDKAQV